MIRNVITKLGLLRTALAVGLAIPFLAVSGAFAQAPASSPAALSPAQPLNAPGATGAAPAPGSQAPTNATGGSASTERVIVTGSNIPTAEEVGPNPVLNINRDLINKSGERSAEELIKNLPVANGGGVPVSNNATGFTPGASAISLRGLGPEATLLLIDGRRVAPFPIGNNGTSSFFDLRSIPEAAVDSIEILKDGASTTYGADAVAGVINIKLRKDYRGAEGTIEYGNTDDKDSGEYRASLIFGVGDENTNVTGVMNFYHRSSIFQRDRGYSTKPPFLSTNATPLNLQVTFESVAAAGGGAAATAAGFGPGDVFFAHAPFGSNGLDPASAFTFTAGRSSTFNFNATAGSFPDIENYGGFVSFDHKICGDQLVLFGDLYYQNTTTHNELAPGATGPFQTPGSVTLAIPPGTNLNGVAPPGTPTFAETGVPANAFNPFNPFNQIISGGTRARLFEFGNRLADDETDAFLSTVGFKGDKLLDGTWGYDAGFRYSNVKASNSTSQTSSSRFNRILNQNDPIFQPGGILAGQPAYNPFGDALRGPDIAANAAAVAFATSHPKDVDTSELATLDLNIYTTSLFKLPAGGVGFAFGGQFRREQLFQDVDQINIEADIPGNSPAATTNAGRKDFAFYAEALIPVFSSTFRVPGFYALDFSAAVRYEEFRNNNTNVTAPKFGVRWQPIDESLTIRATIGEGFREPSLIELFASPTSSLVGTTDPLPFAQGGPNIPLGDPRRREPETNNVTTSSPALQPEDSRSFSGGIVYTPKFVGGLTLSIDVWDIERTGVVIQSTANDVLQDELNGAFAPGEAVNRDAAGVITRIFTPFVNSGSLKARGLDFGLQYAYQTSFGTFTSLTNATYLDSFQLAVRPGQTERELAGNTTDQSASDDGYLKWKGISRLDWAWKGFDVIGTVRYTDGFHEHKFINVKREHYAQQTWVFDAQASYDFTFAAPVESQPVAGYSKDGKEMVRGKDGKTVEPTQTASYSMPCWKNLVNNTTFAIGCNNVFGQDPPKAYGGSGNSSGYPDFLYDSTGRFVYASITKKF